MMNFDADVFFYSKSHKPLYVTSFSTQNIHVGEIFDQKKGEWCKV